MPFATPRSWRHPSFSGFSGLESDHRVLPPCRARTLLTLYPGGFEVQSGVLHLLGFISGVRRGGKGIPISSLVVEMDLLPARRLNLSKKLSLFRSKSSPYKLCTASPIKLYPERVSRTGSVFPIFRGYKLIDKAVQILYGLVLQSRPHSIPVAIDCTGERQGRRRGCVGAGGRGAGSGDRADSMDGGVRPSSCAGGVPACQRVSVPACQCAGGVPGCT